MKKQGEGGWGYTANLYRVEWSGWTEAYGYLGSYYTTFQRAKFEINFLMREFPGKYAHWAIERVWIDEDDCRPTHPKTVVLAHSKDAPIWSCEDQRAVELIPPN